MSIPEEKNLGIKKSELQSLLDSVYGEISEKANARHMTYDEYSRLSEEEKVNGTVYFIPDTPSPGIYVDEELNLDSKNPLTNSAITTALGDKADKSEIPTPYDDTAIKTLIGNKADKATTLAGYGITDAVKNDDARLTDARPASDVKSWAKADNKPTYTASEVGALASTVTHLSGDIAAIEKGANNGVATLGSDGKVPSTQLPSYVDDVLEYSAKSSFPTTGESGKIYVNTADNKTYRWSGSAYVEISPSIALGETSSTAYAGDKGKAVTDALATHKADTTAHITAAERTAWNAKGTYSKPSDGIPKTDLATAVQTSLDKADTALQEHQDISGKLNVSGDNGTADGVSALISKLTVGAATPADNDYYVSQSSVSATTYHRRPMTALWNYIKGKVEALGYTKNTGTITEIKMNGTSKGTSGSVDLGTVLTSHQDISGKQDKGYYMIASERTGNIDDLAQSVRYTSGGCGSINLVKKETGTGSSIPNGWYNYLYLPHRIGTNAGDNGNYGTIIMTPMTFDGSTFILRCHNAVVADVKKIDPNTDTHLTETDISGMGFTKNTGTVTSVKVGTTSYSQSGGVVSLPAYPTSLPANGGNADTVSGHTVGIDVPADAKFTDTTYSVFSQDNAGLVPAPTADDVGKFLKGDGTWGEGGSGGGYNYLNTSLYDICKFI